MANVKRSLLPIGIHLTADGVQMVQLSEAGDRIEVVSKAAQYFTSPADTLARVVAAGSGGIVGSGRSDPREVHYNRCREFVRQKITRDGFRGKDAVIGLPAENLVIQHVRMAPMQPGELAAALPYEIEGKLPFKPSDAIIRHIVAGAVTENNEAKQDVLVLASEQYVVEKHVAAMARMGLNIVGVGVEPCAMCYPYAYASTHAAASQSGPPCLMVVYLGPGTTHVGILRGQETTFVKGVDHGTDELLEAVAKVRSVSLESAAEMVGAWREKPGQESFEQALDVYNSIAWSLEHLVDEIQSCVRYHASLSRGAPIDRLYFVGPEARDRALVSVLSAQLNVPCEIGDPIAAVCGRPDADGPRPDMAVAVGLSLFGSKD